MLGFAWLAVRQAQEALKNGRLEDAYRLLSQPAAQGHKGSYEMLQQVAQRFVERGEKHLRKEDPTAAWNDLLAAEQVGAADVPAARLRQELARLGLAEARSLLEAGEPTRAVEVLTQLRNRSVRQSEMAKLEEAAKGWVLARELADRGEFTQAVQTVERVLRLLPGRLPLLEKFQAELEQRGPKFAKLLVDLHQAADQKQWNDVVQGILKPFVFAMIIALVGCYYGMQTTGGTPGVGRSTTRGSDCGSRQTFRASLWRNL